MDERERKELAWWSCFFGIRVALQALTVSQESENLDKCLRLLGAVARGEMPLPEPLSNPIDSIRPSDPLTGPGNKPVLSDRDLASLIIAGLDLAATKEPPETVPLHAERPPLRVDEGGVVRVGKSRINLDLVVREYENGMTAEDMIRAYDTLELADVHAVIAYYLRHGALVNAYLNRREAEAIRLRTLIESRQPPHPTKEELLARREKNHAKTGQ
jgi:uncharacterized protein (DUF433 family)